MLWTLALHYNDDSGTAQTATKSGAASGGYNIADAQICSTFDGGWEGCGSPRGEVGWGRGDGGAACGGGPAASCVGDGWEWVT
jgi:hypothetical protein